MAITTLFNLFCPFLLHVTSIKYSVCLHISFLVMIIWFLMEIMILMHIDIDLKTLFPSDYSAISVYFLAFMLLCLFNLFSMVTYSYPVSTTLLFNLCFSITVWLGSVFILLSKDFSLKSFLPSNTPWYLVPFLSLVELISVLVRPVTLAFRLMANMCAGHILLTLMLKLAFGAWMLSILFGILELMVCIVQAYVFVMLTSVYFMESK